MTLEVLRCERCGAAVPLRVASSIACRHCQAEVAIPERWRAAAEAHAAAEVVRREVEPRWRALSAGVGVRVEVAAMTLLVVGPPLATWWAQASAAPPAPIENLSHVAFPALLPGALLWLWATTVNAAVLRVRRLVRARAEGPQGDLACRSCGAPLAPQPGALAATCLYCGTDSVVCDLPPAVDSEAQRDQALRTLADAAQVLRRRRVNLALGISVLGLAVAAMVAATSVAIAAAS